MHEVGLDLSEKKPKSVFELFKQGKLLDHVITVCHNSASRCPLFPGITHRWHWPFPDPAAVRATDAEKLEAVRNVENMIEDWLLNAPDNTINFKVLLEHRD